MIGLALPALETLINQTLRLDPDTLSRLQALNEKVIKIEILDWKCELFVVPNINGISLYASYSDPVNTTITGKLFALFQVGLRKGKTTELFNHKIGITGDNETGEKIRDILAQLDIDWEEQIAKVAGDIPANKIGNLARKLKQVASNAFQTVEINLKEFLHDECSAFPTKEEVNQFCSDVCELRNAVDRVEARLNLLETARKSSP